MEGYAALYAQNPLFSGIQPESLLALLQCLKAQKKTYPKGAVLFSEGERVSRLGLILSGRVNTVYGDAFGNRSILGSMEPGQLFCDAFSCATDNRAPVSVVAQTECQVLLIQIELVLHTCAYACQQHQRLAENLVHILADKYMAQSRKMLHLSQKTTRRKLLSYLWEQQRQAGGGAFSVPFNRQELADYLFVDRTGLSAQWSLLLRQGLLREEGSRYRLGGGQERPGEAGPSPAANERKTSVTDL